MAIPGSYWGGMFPEEEGLSYFAGHFPIVVGGSQPATVGALILESGSVMTINWSTGIAEPLAGQERRANLYEDPVLEFEGPALIANTTVRATRAMLAEFAALGQPFSLGLPWESVTMQGASSGTVLPTPATSGIDWAEPGVRVMIVHKVYGVVETYIVSVAAYAITVGDAVGDVGSRAAEIMPVIQVLLDPQQSFLRYAGEDDVERWTIKATAIVPGIIASATYATLELDTIGGSGVMDGVTIRALETGSAGNDLSIQFIGDAVSFDYAEIVGQLLIYHFIPDTTTVAGMIGRIERTDFAALLGDRTSDVLTIADEFGPTALTGGIDQLPVEMGKGATLAMLASRPVWDRGIIITSGAQDSIQSRAQVVRLGASNFAAPKGAVPDWGRQISLRAEIFDEWQWVKKIMWYAKGAWRAFWLPTWRNDMVFVSSGVGTIVIQSGAAAGDFFKWYPATRRYIQVVQDTIITYAFISNAVDNLDGTITLTVFDDNEDPITLSADDVDMLSWMELTRFSDDSQRPSFSQQIMTLTETGRVVQR